MRSKSAPLADRKSPAAAPSRTQLGLQPRRTAEAPGSEPGSTRFGHDFGAVRVHAGPQTAAQAQSPVLQRKPAARVAREVVGTKAAASNILLFPEGPPPGVRTGVLAHTRGSLEGDISLRPRVSAILGPGATIRGIAKLIHPHFVAAAPAGAPTVEELAQAILVYSRFHIPVPAMTRFRVGLRIPLPIEIDVVTGEWVVNLGDIRAWAGIFDPTWAPLIDRAPEDLKVATAADQEAAVDDFLAKHKTPLSRGIALGARLLTNAFESDQFALRVFDRLGDTEGFDVALELMRFTMVHQAELFASQGAAQGVLWRVLTLLSLPPAGLDARREKERQRLLGLGLLPAETILGLTAKKQPVQAFLFPGTSSERALIIAGVHGSEQSGVEVVELLLDELRKPGVRPHFTTLVVPKLFPDNYDEALREGSTETNRNFPTRGTSLDTARQKGGAKGPIDDLGKKILPENIMFLQLLERFRPSRVATVHATFTKSKAGVFTDPRIASPGALAAAKARGESTDALVKEAEKATEQDKDLAFAMAYEAQKRGANVKGNKLEEGREKFGSDFPAPKPVGVSLGGYGPQDVTEGKATDRPSMTVITMEVGGNERSAKETNAKKREARLTELRAFRDVLLFLFLRAPGAPGP